jgi:hypothetical protein
MSTVITSDWVSTSITPIDAAIYKTIASHTIESTGIFSEKFLVLITVKKKGRKKTRYITPIDAQIKISVRVSSLFPLKEKKANKIIPAPARKRIILINNDMFFDIESPLI